MIQVCFPEVRCRGMCNCMRHDQLVNVSLDILLSDLSKWKKNVKENTSSDNIKIL